MGLSKKRKQHLAQITARAAESNKHRKIGSRKPTKGGDFGGNKDKKKTFGMSTMIFDQNLALIQTSMSAAPMKKIRG